MQSKRRKRSRIRAASITAGHGHKKKNRGAGHRGGRGNAGGGKRGDAKLMKVTKGIRDMGKHGFTPRPETIKTINLETLQSSLNSMVEKKQAALKDGIFTVDLTALGIDKLLSKGRVYLKMNIKVSSMTKNAVDKVTKAGGKIEENK